jgi:PGF-CTERM protein
MKYQNLVFVLASAAVLIMSATAQNPADIIGAPIKEKISQAQAQIPQEITQHIIEGNITSEHLQKDVNATAQELKKTAAQELQQHSNVTAQDLQKMAEQEIKNQVTQKVQQPGFEAAFAAAGILATAYILRRRN